MSDRYVVMPVDAARASGKRAAGSDSAATAVRWCDELNRGAAHGAAIVDTLTPAETTADRCPTCGQVRKP